VVIGIINSHQGRAGIPGIGVAYKSRLTSNGFNNAADIDWRVSRVHGIGPTRQSALLQWRKSLENEAISSAPSLSPQERLSIENKYRQERQFLEAEKQRLQSQFDGQIASVRQFFGEARQALNQEEQQIRMANAQKKARVQGQHDIEVAALEKYASDARILAAPTMNELSEKLRTAQKQIFALRWQSAKHAKEGRRFASLRFRDYLLKIISV
jgi:hypothetical protein